MFPILFQVGTLQIQSYGFFVSLSYLFALAVVVALGRKKGVASSTSIDLVFFSLILGILGARTLFVITEWQYFLENPFEVFKIWKGGLVFYGGFLVCLPFIYFYSKYKKISASTCFDVLTLGLILGHAVGRVGCLAAGCCHGSSTTLPWGIILNTQLVELSLRNTPLHPVQAYESIALFILFLILCIVFVKTQKSGLIANLYLIFYPLIRFSLEFFRGDSIRGFLFSEKFSTSQFISIVIFICGIAIALLRWRGTRRRA